jgi:hypothetical protein
VKGGLHQFALSLSPAVDIHLHRFLNFIVVGNVSALRHASEGRDEPNWASTAKDGQSGSPDGEESNFSVAPPPTPCGVYLRFSNCRLRLGLFFAALQVSARMFGGRNENIITP